MLSGTPGSDPATHAAVLRWCRPIILSLRKQVLAGVCRPTEWRLSFYHEPYACKARFRPKNVDNDWIIWTFIFCAILTSKVASLAWIPVIFPSMYSSACYLPRSEMIRCMSPGLLQLTFQPHIRRTVWPGCMQSDQNAAARLVSGARRYDHITGFRSGSRWTSTGPYSLLSGMTYLAADCQPSPKKVDVICVLPTRGLVSSGGPTATLGTDVPRQRDMGYEHFKRLLKTCFWRWDRSAVWPFV